MPCTSLGAELTHTPFTPFPFRNARWFGALSTPPTLISKTWLEFSMITELWIYLKLIWKIPPQGVDQNGSRNRPGRPRTLWFWNWYDVPERDAKTTVELKHKGPCDGGAAFGVKWGQVTTRSQTRSSHTDITQIGGSLHIFETKPCMFLWGTQAFQVKRALSKSMKYQNKISEHLPCFATLNLIIPT